MQYLKAVKAAGTKDADAVAKKLKELPVDDAFTAHGHVQANGRMVTNLYLFEVKKPSESKRDWDYYKLFATVPGETAYLTAANSGCPLTSKRNKRTALGVLLGASACHRDRRLAGVLMLRRVNEKLLKLAVVALGVALTIGLFWTAP